MEELQIKIAAQSGFHMLQHQMDIYGLCHACLTSRKPLMPLSMAREGEKFLVREILGGGNAKSRLASMGVRPNDRIEVINNDGFGRVILGHECTRIAIGKGMAKKIMVSLAEEGDEPVCEEDDQN
jgi:Fur family ferric uptake transcriptional regulator